MSGSVLVLIEHDRGVPADTAFQALGLARPTSGSATVAGADCVRETRKIKRLVGYMPDTGYATDAPKPFVSRAIRGRTRLIGALQAAPR